MMSETKKLSRNLNPTSGWREQGSALPGRSVTADRLRKPIAKARKRVGLILPTPDRRHECVVIGGRDGGGGPGGAELEIA